MDTEERHELAIGHLAIGGWFSRALGVAARLGIADVLGDDHLTAERIAERTDTNAEVMTRLLRALTFCGVTQRNEAGEFGLTAKFAQLRTDHPLSLRHICMLFTETYDDAFGALLHTVRTGKSGFQQVFGMSLFEYFEQDEEAARVFDLAMVELARPVAHSLAQVHDFTAVDRIVDVGGGGGAMLRGILRIHPHLAGISADRESVCDRALANLASSPDSDLADRLTFAPADFFTEVPSGGDRYLLKNVLHDWTFESCRRILGTVRTAMTEPGARLLVIEPPISEDFDAARELFQMVALEEGMCGLTEEGMRELIGSSGFDIQSVTKLPTGHNVYESIVGR